MSGPAMKETRLALSAFLSQAQLCDKGVKCFREKFELSL